MGSGRIKAAEEHLNSTTEEPKLRSVSPKNAGISAVFSQIVQTLEGKLCVEARAFMDCTLSPVKLRFGKQQP
jgi:hypothetical protein